MAQQGFVRPVWPNSDTTRFASIRHCAVRVANFRFFTSFSFRLTHTVVLRKWHVRGNPGTLRLGSRIKPLPVRTALIPNENRAVHVVAIDPRVDYHGAIEQLALQRKHPSRFSVLTVQQQDCFAPCRWKLVRTVNRQVGKPLLPQSVPFCSQVTSINRSPD